MASNVNQHNQLLQVFAAYAKRLNKLYDDFVTRLIAALPLTEEEIWNELAQNPLFRFDSLPYLRSRLNHIFNDFVNDQILCYKAGITDGVALAFSQDAINLGKYTVLQDEAIKAARDAAVASFIANRMSRKDGLSLSDKVWNYSQLGKSEVEMGISNVLKEGLKAGTSAEELGRKVRQYLNNPTMMYRRYWVTAADSAGNKKKVARWYRRHINEKTGKVTFKDEPLEKVGMGVYRSARMNSYRLMRTEINMSYHKANSSRWAIEPFVYGIRIWLSPQHPEYDICDELQGDYPKDFIFSGWHPNCLCAAKPLTLYGEEKRDFYRRLMKGEDMSNFHSKNEITEANMNLKWKQYIEANHDKIKNAAERDKLAYFLRDNQSYWISNFSATERKEMGLQAASSKDNITQIAKERHAARSKEKEKYLTEWWHKHKQDDAVVRKAQSLVGELMDYPKVATVQKTLEAIKSRDISFLESVLENKRLKSRLAFEKSITPDIIRDSVLRKKYGDAAVEALYNETARVMSSYDGFGTETKIDAYRHKASLARAKNELPQAAIYEREAARLEARLEFASLKAKAESLDKELLQYNLKPILTGEERYWDKDALSKTLASYKPYEDKLNRLKAVDDFIAKAKPKSTIVKQLRDGITYAFSQYGIRADIEETLSKLEKKIERLKSPSRKGISPLMNEKLAAGGEYLGKDDKFVFDRGFFDMFKDKIEVEIPHTGKGSYASQGKKICLDSSPSRINNSKWYKHNVVYHEGGHAIADQRGMYSRPELIELREKMIKRLKKQVTYTEYKNDFSHYIESEKRYAKIKTTRKRALWKDLDARLQELEFRIYRISSLRFEKLGITRQDVEEQIGAVRDTISSLFKQNNYGHSISYFSREYLRRHEFLAHAFENTFIGNRIFEKFMPREYKEMVSLIRTWQKEIKAGKWVTPPTDNSIFNYDK